MANRKSLDAPSELQRAYDALFDFDWDTTPFRPAGTAAEDWSLHLYHWYTYHDREPTAIEEAEIHSLWLRTSAVRQNLTQVCTLFQLCHDFYIRLSQYQLKQLGAMALLKEASWQDSRDSISFLPEFLPDRPPLDFIQYQRRFGGRLAFGTKLLWWCAVAYAPLELEFHESFRFQLVYQPFWAKEAGRGRCLFRQEPLELITNAAMRLMESQSAAPIDDDRKIQPDGPGPGMRFWWKGKFAKLDAKDYQIAELIYSDGKMRVSVGEIYEQMWPGKTPNSSTLSAALTRIREKFDEAELGLQIDSKINRGYRTLISLPTGKLAKASNPKMAKAKAGKAGKSAAKTPSSEASKRPAKRAAKKRH